MTGTRLGLVAALLIAVIASGGRAHAESAEAEVERLANEAVLAYKGADYHRAVDLLQRAYEIRQVPALLYNMAKAYDKLGDVDRADDAYHKYVLSAAAEPKLKAKAEARIAALDPIVKKKHEEEARQAAEEAAQRAAVETAQQPKAIVVPVEKPVDTHETFLRKRHHARLVALGLGAGTVALALVAMSLSIDALVLQHQYSASTSPDVKDRDKSDAIVRAGVADGFWAAAAVGAAVTGYFVYRGFLQKEKVTVAPTASLSGGGLAVSGRF